MEYYKIEHSNDRFYLPDFPNSEKIIHLKGKKPGRLADLALHLADLNNASECLNNLILYPEDNFIRRMLWRMAIILVMKCYTSNKGRPSQLQSTQVLKGDVEGQEVFNYFLNLRNKNIVHDENSISQAIPGAILNEKDAEYKIAKIICLAAEGETCSGENISNLRVLINRTETYVKTQYDEICNIITNELQQLTHSQLSEMDQMKYNKPKIEDIGNNKRLL